MRLALINPPSPFLTDQRVFPNMGLVRLATQLDKKHDVTFIDFAGDDRIYEKMRSTATYFDYYMFSSTSPQFKYTYKLFKELKKANPKAKTVIGGPHASAMYSLRERNISHNSCRCRVEDPNIIDLEVFDTIFTGEGEDTTNLFKPGWQKGELIKDLDSLPIPNRKFLDRVPYNYDLLGKPTTSIQTQRGCPGKCTFCCGRDIEMYNRVRQHSPERVVKEMDNLNEEFGYASFMWYDDEVNLNPTRLEELCDRLSKRPYQHRGFIRSDYIVKNPESVNWLKKAGFVKLCAGVESGSDRILKRINKGVTVEQNYEARRLIKEAGIHYEAFTMLGFPTETKQDVGKTREWLIRAKPDDFDIGILTPYPGSKIYDEAVHSDKFKGYDWEYKGLFFNKPDYSVEDSFYKGLNAQSKVSSRTNTMPEKYIHKMRDKIEAMK